MSQYLKTLYLYYKIKNKIITETYLDDKPLSTSSSKDDNNESNDDEYQLAGILNVINFEKVGYEPVGFTTFSIKNNPNELERNNRNFYFYSESMEHIIDPLSIDPKLLYFMTYNTPVKYTTKLYFYHTEENTKRLYPLFNKDYVKYLPKDKGLIVEKRFSPLFFMWKVKSKINDNGEIELIKNTEINPFGYYEFFHCEQNICRPSNEDISTQNFVECQDDCLKYNIRERGEELRLLKPKKNISTEIVFRNLIILFLVIIIILIVIFDISLFV